LSATTRIEDILDQGPLIAKLMDEWRLTDDDLRRVDGAPRGELLPEQRGKPRV